MVAGAERRFFEGGDRRESAQVQYDRGGQSELQVGHNSMLLSLFNIRKIKPYLTQYATQLIVQTIFIVDGIHYLEISWLLLLIIIIALNTLPSALSRVGHLQMF